MAFGCLALSTGLAGGLLWQSARGSVTPWIVQVDRLGQAQAIAPAAYDFVTDRGALALNDFARNADPFAKIGKMQVTIEISSVIRASPESFRIAWIERRYENAQLASTERWTAILSVVVQTPHEADRLRKNPLGLFVNAINWSKELGQ